MQYPLIAGNGISPPHCHERSKFAPIIDSLQQWPITTHSDRLSIWYRINVRVAGGRTRKTLLPQKTVSGQPSMVEPLPVAAMD